MHAIVYSVFSSQSGVVIATDGIWMQVSRYYAVTNCWQHVTVTAV